MQTTLKKIFLLSSIVCLGFIPFSEPVESIGPTLIPFYTGNLSVTQFMKYWGTNKDSVNINKSDWPKGNAEVLKQISCDGETDYQSWALAEKEKGKWDFSIYAENADSLHANGLKYYIFPWVHFPPKWFHQNKECVFYKCAEHGEQITQLSPWSPYIFDIYRSYYAALHSAMGNKVDVIRIATPSEYGEIGFPVGMTNWLVPQTHIHPGYWCGDQYAIANFKNYAKEKFMDIPTLNKHWGTNFSSWNSVSFPELIEEQAAKTALASGKPTDRRRWLDFIEWYYGTWLKFVPKLSGIVKEFYPNQSQIVSIGYASENTWYGNDYSLTPKICKANNLALQTPGNVSYYALKRLSTSCHFYNCAYYTEPPSSVDVEKEVARIFNDVSNGVQTFFDYVENLKTAIPQFKIYKKHMTGAKPLVDIAIFNPTIEHRLRGGKDPSMPWYQFPVHTFNLSEQLRDLMDFDIVDEFLIRDNILNQYRVLIYTQGEVTEEFALKKITEWVEKGGILICADLNKVTTIENDESYWNKLLPKYNGTATEDISEDMSEIFEKNSKRIKKGIVIRFPWKQNEYEKIANGIVHFNTNIKKYDKNFKNGIMIDCKKDSINTTYFKDRILFHNYSSKKITRKIKLRNEDWEYQSMKPEREEYEIAIDKHSIEAIYLNKK